MKNSQIQIMIEATLIVTQTPRGYRRFQIGCVFAEYDLFKPTFLYNIWYIPNFLYKFDSVLYQLLKTGT